MKTLLRVLFWCIVFVAMCLLFCLTGTETARADDGITVTLLSEDTEITLPLCEYIVGALGAEMPVGFETEALKAQAVAIRSYILAGARHGDMTLCTNSACCMGYCTAEERSALWGDRAEEYTDRLRAAARETDGEYLTYEGQAAQAVFHAGSFGMTEDSAALWSPLPYLISVDTPETEADVLSLRSLAPGELAQALGFSDSGDPAQWVENISYEASGRVQSVRIKGVVFSGTELRSRLGLAGTDFDVSLEGDCFVFTVRGKGHGVGMSQTGANILASEGLDYKAILAHYYPGTELSRLSPSSQ